MSRMTWTSLYYLLHDSTSIMQLILYIVLGLSNTMWSLPIQDEPERLRQLVYDWDVQPIMNGGELQTIEQARQFLGVSEAAEFRRFSDQGEILLDRKGAAKIQLSSLQER